MSYRELRVWQEARELSVAIHQMTLRELPKYELYEEGQQIRRSSKSIRSNIVEGYGRRRHKLDYLRFLDYAFASCLETEDHLEILFETLLNQTQTLGRKLNHFISSVEKQHNAPRPNDT